MRQIKILFAIFVLAVAALICSWGITTIDAQPANDTSMNTAALMAIANTSMPSETPSAEATSMPTATATIDYISTSQVLQGQLDQTQKQLDDAKRLMVEVTAQHEANVQQQNAWTAEASNQQYQIQSWTATAALTSVPATQTQTTFNSIMMPTNQSIIMTSQAMTQQAPTQIIVIAQAQAQADHAGWLITMQVALGIAISALTIALAFWLIKLGLHYSSAAIAKSDDGGSKTETASGPDFEADTDQHIVMQSADPIYPSVQKIKNPFAPDEWNIVIEYYTEINSLAIGKWDKKKNGRDLVLRLRAFVMENNFAYRSGDGQITLNHDGMKFLDAISNGSPLPHYYDVDPNTKHFTEDDNHDHEIHEHESKPGEGFIPAPANS